MHELRRLVDPERPSKDSTRVSIHHRREVSPRAAHLQVRHVADPNLIELLVFDLYDSVAGAREESPEPRYPSIQRRGTGPHAVFPHQPLNPSTSGLLSPLLQHLVHSRASVRLATRRVRVANYF